MSVHELAKQIRTGQHVPDILDCLAQLSNDEVPTPPKLARAMLDLLPGEVWGNADYAWLDPFCKSGIFLRESAARLLDGLSDQIPDFQERREHIYRDMLWGTSITEMTGMIARRSLYYSRDASGPASVVRFKDDAGNVPFVSAEHTFPSNDDGTVRGACTVCGAPPDLERGRDRENYAYSFIHGAYPTKGIENMKFDVIVGNPPYQIDSDGNTRTKPVYQRFVQQAIKLDPRFVVMVTPSRWFTGGLGLDEYRRQMVNDRRIRKMVDNPKLFDCFPGVEIKGGVSYFLWDRSHSGDCEFFVRVNGVIQSSGIRDLRRGRGVLIRSNEADTILRKIEDRSEPSASHRISAQKPFGLLSNFSAFHLKPSGDSIRLYKRGLADAWVAPEQVEMGRELVGPIKVLTPEAGDGHGRIPATVTGNPFVVGGNSVCTQTFLVAGTWPSLEEAENFAIYLRTKFVRFLIHQRKVSQHSTGDAYLFVPDLPMTRAWSDAELYARYGLTDAEVEHVESQIKPMNPGVTDD